MASSSSFRGFFSPPSPPSQSTGEETQIDLYKALQLIFLQSLIRPDPTNPINTVPEHLTWKANASIILKDYEFCPPGDVNTGGAADTTPLVIASSGVGLQSIENVRGTLVRMAAQLMMIMDNNIGLVVGINDRIGLTEDNAVVVSDGIQEYKSSLAFL